MNIIKNIKSKDGTNFSLFEDDNIFIIENLDTCGACFHFDNKQSAINMIELIGSAIFAI